MSDQFKYQAKVSEVLGDDQYKIVMFTGKRKIECPIGHVFVASEGFKVGDEVVYKSSNRTISTMCDTCTCTYNECDPNNICDNCTCWYRYKQ